MTNAWQSLRQSTGLFADNNEAPPELPPEESYADALHDTMSLTYTQRITAFGLSFGMGLIFLLIAISMLPAIVLFVSKFAFFFTCGNVFCVGSTVFLLGFRAQLSKMFEAHRAQATIVYICSTILTLVSALYFKSSTGALVCVSAQIASLLWYALSYIPFARHTVGFLWQYAWMLLRPLLNVVYVVVSQFCSCLLRLCNR